MRNFGGAAVSTSGDMRETPSVRGRLRPAQGDSERLAALQSAAKCRSQSEVAGTVSTDSSQVKSNMWPAAPRAAECEAVPTLFAFVASVGGCVNGVKTLGQRSAAARLPVSREGESTMGQDAQHVDPP